MQNELTDQDPITTLRLVPGIHGVAPAGPATPIALAPQMRHIFSLLEQLKRTSLPLLLLGETGAGKEVIADWAHQLSAQAGRPLVKTNCAGLTESVVESELFGHDRGAFTGALQTHRGLFEVADGGTLFLDELAELPLRTQAKLLRVIETGEFSRLGSTQTRRVKVRFIAATHCDLLRRVEQGAFRSDLYFRLNGAIIVIPPLRERRQEIVPLASLFLERAARSLGRPPMRLSQEAAELLRKHSWPGNVRELRNTIEYAAALCPGQVLEARALAIAAPLRGPASAAEPRPPETDSFTREPGTSNGKLKHQLLAFERERICKAIEESHGNQTHAAKLLGISRRTLTNKLNLHALGRPRKLSIPQAGR